VLQALSAGNILMPETNPEEDGLAARAGDGYNHVRQLLLETLTPTGAFLRYQGGKSSIEIGKWWPKQEGESAAPLADRVEMRIVNLLQESRPLAWAEIDRTLCVDFPGLQTPDRQLIQTVLQSYAALDPGGRWMLRGNDAAASRREDVAEIYQLLAETGEKFGLKVRKDRLLVWEAALNGQDLHFTVIASGMLARILDAAGHPPEQGVIVLPGGRAELVMFKRERDPRLDFRLDGGWRILKFRHVRRMAESKSVSLENLASYLTLDPITVDEAQMPLL
jgi:hypothetical protein